jgi:hypothetical protein
VIAALALAAAPALPPNFPKATKATIEQVRADPRGWNGRWVEVTGWMHQCSSLDCSVFEQPLGGGMSLSFQAADSLDRWIEPLLPAEVVVVARIDSECLINFCTDRAPVLREPHVMTLRWNVGNLTKDQ